MTLIEQLPKVRGRYRLGAELAKTNWFGVGGKAEVLFRPEDVSDLSYFLANKPASMPVTIIGVGSNLLIRDGGIDGVVIKLGRAFTSIYQEDNLIHAGAGALDYNVSIFAKEAGLAGLEFLSGIPGSIGGALAMNAGAYGNDTAAMLRVAEAIDENGKLHELSPEAIGFVYRGNNMPSGWIFTKAIFKCTRGDQAEIAAKMAAINESRENSQPIRTKTTGSCFANPPGLKAWQLIDQAGCRGLKVGGAVMSEKHCNFMINAQNASAQDLENLGEEVRRRVKEVTGVELKWEVKRVGKY